MSSPRPTTAQDDQDRRRQAAVELRQSRARREEAGALGGQRPDGNPGQRRQAAKGATPKPSNQQARNTQLLGQQPHLHARGDRRHPHQVGARPLPHARLLALQEDPALGRPDLPAGHADALRHRGLSREVHHQDGDRPERQAAAGARHPRLHHRHELRRALLRGQDRARARRHHGGHGDLLGRRRHDPRRAALFVQVVLPVHPVALRLQPAPSRVSPTPSSSSSARAARSASAAI